jgi:hypothetical protein
MIGNPFKTLQDLTRGSCTDLHIVSAIGSDFS